MSYTNLEFSKMTLEDFNEIKENLLTDFDDFWNVTTFESELKSSNSFYIVAKLEGEIVGFARNEICFKWSRYYEYCN